MKLLVYSTKKFERPFLTDSQNVITEMKLTEKSLSLDTAEDARGYDVISIFTGDDASGAVIRKLAMEGVRFIAVRAAGYDNIDLITAAAVGIRVANVPGYSPYAIAEHAVTLMLSLNRKIMIADRQVHRHDFTVDGLVGFDLHGKKVGIIGTGKTGMALIKILHGFGCHLLAYDMIENKDLSAMYGVKYVTLQQLCAEADVISLHTSLTPQTKYLINKDLIRLMKKGVMLINTSRGACVNTADVLDYLNYGHIGSYGADVYEKEKGVFFYDWSAKDLQDPVLEKLLLFPNVLITPHQAFATREALSNIAATTFHNIYCWSRCCTCENELYSAPVETYG